MTDVTKAKTAVFDLRSFGERNRASGGALLKKYVGSAVYKIYFALLLFGLCFMILQPLINQLCVSVMPDKDLFDPTVTNIPHQFTLLRYSAVLNLMNYFQSLLLTVGIVSAGAVLQIAACTLAGYSLARFKYPLRNFWFFCMLLIIIVPPQTIMSSLYLNFRFFDILGIVKLMTGAKINMLNSPAAYLLLCATGMGLKNGLFVFMLRQYFRGVPKELEEAAWVDGCGRLRTFAQIILPDAMPMVTSCFLFSFVWQWTDSYYSYLFLSKINTLMNMFRGLSSKYSQLVGGTVSEAISSAVNSTATLLILVPVVMLYLFAQKAFVHSLNQTGIKM